MARIHYQRRNSVVNETVPTKFSSTKRKIVFAVGYKPNNLDSAQC
jgi:hypothetical protein